MRKKIIEGALVAVLFLIAMPASSYACSGTRNSISCLDYDDSWTEMRPVSGPPGRVDSPLVYDSESDVVILFGGLLGPGRPKQGDTWAYSYESNAWTNMSPSVAPDVRGAHMLTYDSESDRVILFSGFIRIDDVTGHVNYNETWAYDYNSNTWTNLHPRTMPTPRAYPAMGYDEDSDRIIIFGGILEGTSVAADTWAYDYNTNTWENMNPPSSPSPRFAAAMTYNSAADRMILYGEDQTDTWAYDYDSNTWTNLNPSTHPSDGAWYMTYDAEDDLCMFFGVGEDTNDIWLYNYTSNSWNSSTPSTRPSVRSRAPLAYDEDSDVTILFGGMTGWFESHFNDTWAYDIDIVTTTNGPTTTDGFDPILLGVGVGAVVLVLVVVVFIRKR